MLARHGVELFLKREDLIDEYISGNKFHKLKFNLLEAQKLGFRKLLTFGGAYSNHIHAVAYAGRKYGFETLGIIRGEEILPLNPTLKDATDWGMQLRYVSRAEFRKKEDPKFPDQIQQEYGRCYIIPEGGSNVLAVKGCQDIVRGLPPNFDHIAVCCGTGGTMAGIIAGMHGESRILGFPVLKDGGFLAVAIKQLLRDYDGQKYENWRLIDQYHFGGYAKFNNSLIDFINQFKKKQGIRLDPIYTGKMMFGIYDLIEKGFFTRGSRILAIHTGGIQGIRGFNRRFGNIINE